MKAIFFLIMFSVFSFTSAQNIKLNYSPVNKDSLISYIDNIYSKKITKFGVKNKKDIEEIVLERKKKFIKNLEDSTFVFDKKINNYINYILREIYKSNQIAERKDFYFFLDKSPIPNAACYGNGIFTVNLGLFNFVNSDDELAFILCHEIAHFELDHNDKSLLKYVETFNSKDTKQKIKAIKKLDYGKRKAYSDFVEKMNFNFLKRSREAELQADSLGFILYNRTKFVKVASVTALKNLDIVDDMLFNEDSQIRKHFNFESYPFKEVWIQKDQTLFDLDNASDDFSINKDSLKTHPDIPLRIDFLNKMIKDKSENINLSNQNLKEIKEHVSLLTIKNSLDDKKVDFALYQTLILFNRKEIDEKMYCLIISNLLQKVYELKRDHQFGKYVAPVSPFSDEMHLNEVKQFLHNIELKNVKKIGLNFCVKHKDLMDGDAEFKKVTEYFIKLNYN